MEGNLKSLGWYLSEEGVVQCEKQRQDCGYKDVASVALEMDLRSVGAPSLPVMAAKRRRQLVGPLILQLQKVKNVALSPSKQNSQSSKRFLRLELTDGHKNISAVELQGPIDQLSLDTPPGTKIRIKGNVEVANGFLLLSKSSVNVLGGRVEGLLKKWHTTKVVPDNLGRVVENNNEEGPPQFVKFDKSGKVPSSSSGSVSTKQSGPSIQKPRQSSPARETSTREKMELPSSYFAEGASKRKEDAPSTVKHQDRLVSGMQNLSTNDSGVVDIEALVTPSERNPNLKSRNASGPLAQISHGESDRERGGRGRGRGRGRHRGEEDDDYRQEKRKGFMLSDFLSQREQQGKQHNEVQQRVDTVPNQWPELHTEYVRHTKYGGEIHGGGHDGSIVSGERSGREGRGRGRGRGMPRNWETENVSKKYWNSNEFSSEPTSRDQQNSLHDRDETSHARKGGDSRRQNMQQSDSLPNQNYTTKSKRRIDPQSEVTGTSGENKKMSSELVHDNADYKGNSSFHHTRKEHRRYEPYGNREQQERRGHRGYGTEGRGSNNDEDSNKSGGRGEISEGRQHFHKVQHSDKHREHRGTNSDRNYGEAKSYDPRSLSSQHGTSDYSSRRAVSVSSSKRDFTGSVSRSKASGSSGNNISSLSQHTSGTTVRRALSSSNDDTLGSSQHYFPGSTQHSFPASTQHKVSGYDQAEAASQRGLHDPPKKNDYRTSVSSSSSSTATKVDTDDTSHWDFLYQTGSSKPASATKGKVDIL